MQAQMQGVPFQMAPEDIEDAVAQLEAQLNAQMLQALMPQGDQQDPLVAIRQQELAIKAMESERKAEKDEIDAQLEQQKLMQKAATDAARIESQEDIANQRAAVNMERIRVSQRNRG